MQIRWPDGLTVFGVIFSAQPEKRDICKFFWPTRSIRANPDENYEKV